MLGQQILASLKARPNQMARELARELGVERSQINALLYGELKGQVHQSPDYRWSLLTQKRQQTPKETPYQNTPLARLARYYLACMGQEEVGVSTFAESRYGAPDYYELDTLPQSASELVCQEGFQRMAGKIRSEKGRWVMYLGYPTSLKLLQSRRSSWQGFMVEPVFLFGIELKGANGESVLDLTYPMINQKVLQNYTHAERDALMDELVQLERELGIGEPSQLVELDELAMRLQSIRQEWPWQERIDPEQLSTGINREVALSDIKSAGLFNRAVVIMAERAPFTLGLEAELRQLASLPPGAADGSALGGWLSGNMPEESSLAPTSLIEVLPMNSEQYRAVEAALTKPLSVITGPPGTGKSQVVTNLLINAVWQGQKVLFASKNNKAVDVVEARINNLSTRPILLRAGAGQYQTRLAEYLMSLMAATSGSDDQLHFDEAQVINERLLNELQQIQGSQNTLIELRNTVDSLEQMAERARSILPAELISQIDGLDLGSVKNSLRHFQRSLAQLDKSQNSFLISLFWILIVKNRESEATQKAQPFIENFRLMGLDYPDSVVTESLLSEWQKVAEAAQESLKLVEQFKAYRVGLKKLQSHEPLDVISKRRVGLLSRLASNAARLWDYWLKLQPVRLSNNDRQMLNRYTSLLKMVIETGPEGKLSNTVYREYNGLFPKVSHLLSCWAVTSLSARGKIPFEAGYFDLVVFDEASQCDIASALPLLYRAKRVVVIGDPRQLAHISSLQRWQDQQLLDRFKLISDYPHWAYSVNSLFDLAAGIVAGGNVINLLDHHRSHGDIIEFSNRQFYEGRLRVATRYDGLKRPWSDTPGVSWMHVNGNVERPDTGGALNRAEAEAVVSQLNELVVARGYEGSIGVISPFRGQVNTIRKMVDNNQTLSETLIKHDFLVDTVHRFQGDERDLMIFSPVVSKGMTPGALSFLKNNGNLFNVAITRARGQLIVVGDQTECGRSEIDYLANFSQYAQSLMREQKAQEETVRDLGAQYPVVSNPEQVSDWEKILYEALYKAGIRSLPQYRIEKYVLDLALIEGDQRLDIEVDGERYHRNWTGELCRRDQIRNQRMFELGWDVMRFWVYEIRDDLDGCVERIRLWMAKDG